MIGILAMPTIRLAKQKKLNTSVFIINYPNETNMLVANGGKNLPSTVESSHMLMAKPPYIAIQICQIYQICLGHRQWPVSAHPHRRGDRWTVRVHGWSRDEIWVVEVFRMVGLWVWYLTGWWFQT